MTQVWRLVWRIVASGAVVASAVAVLDVLASWLGIITPFTATTGGALISFFLAGSVLVAAVFCIGWVWLPYIRPQAQVPPPAS
jgi:hypothetical protein